MVKRKLSKQQLRNIQNNKANQLSEDLSSILSGLAISHRGKFIEVEAENGQPIFCQYRQNLGTIVAGDKVLYMPQLNSAYGIIYQVLARKNALIRPSKLSHTHKTMAANIDQLVIMIAVNPLPIEHYIDRYLVAAWHMQITPIIVLNKMDLFDNSDNKLQLKEIMTLYHTLGYICISCSALCDKNLQALKDMLSHKTSIIVGQSGVGKSETLNALFGKQIAQTGEISEQNNRGKHTTTTARLFHLDQNTNIIDSPGIREFGIWHLTETDIFNGFNEFIELDNKCQFRNCQHLENTKGCALDQAVKSGKISRQRLINYHRLIQEVKENYNQW
ncbi:ribosome small subunit-dependent GTPase A [Fastidiosibacter lacustris]|uniref:ribosome small subunit-dependent GTPase A n=1 Tax=Fastidiosibacter lacustris TaxID=2056695 RepID=UPI000E356A3D|nr:ribosome small subunit-dependent GTPase A [Fastidiosibacter lacustris]